MDSLDINAIIAKAKAFTSAPTVAKSYLSPQTYEWHGRVLVPTGSKWERDDYFEVEHYYEPFGAIHLLFEGDILHGHRPNNPCFASSFCHAYGFWPDINSHPSFVRQFELKWKALYDSQPKKFTIPQIGVLNGK